MFNHLGPVLLKRLEGESTVHGFTTEEGQAWYQNEVNAFTKRIVTPLGNQFTKRRSDVTFRNNIYIGLLLMVTKRLSEVNYEFVI